MNLSPLNFDALLRNNGLRGNPEHPYAERPKEKDGRRMSAIVIYKCPVCFMDYDDDETAAEDCCQSVGHPEEAHACPVCNAAAIDPWAAADCCLWKDLDAPARWRIAAAIEAGSTWADELGINARSHA